MSDTQKSIVSMLSNDNLNKTTLYTESGEIIELKHNDLYDIERLTDYLAARLTGTEAVKINLEDYNNPLTPFTDEQLSKAGIKMTKIINGKSVEGIFYPSDAIVEMTVNNETVKIPHVNHLEAHMNRAAADNSPSVMNFFKRIAPIIKSRGHSAEDLMKFIKKSEMPLTNDGRIIAYKRVKSLQKSRIKLHTNITEKNYQEYFVDSHSGNIPQRVGSRVTMPVDMVDASRDRSCSVGLHVANLGYLGGFTGDKTLIVLVDPENFIAVPHGEDTKARVSSYDIIGVMNVHQHKVVNQGSHIKDDISFEKLIKSAIKGNTIPAFEEVLVGNKKITSIKSISVTKNIINNDNNVSGKSLSEDTTNKKETKNIAKSIRDKKNSNNSTLPKEVITTFDMLILGETKTNIANAIGTSTRSIGRWMDKYNFESYKKSNTNEMTIKEKAQYYYNNNEINKLFELKKTKKKSFLDLGLSSEQIKEITRTR